MLDLLAGRASDFALPAHAAVLLQTGSSCAGLQDLLARMAESAGLGPPASGAHLSALSREAVSQDTPQAGRARFCGRAAQGADPSRCVASKRVPGLSRLRNRARTPCSPRRGPKGGLRGLPVCVLLDLQQPLAVVFVRAPTLATTSSAEDRAAGAIWTPCPSHVCWNYGGRGIVRRHQLYFST